MQTEERASWYTSAADCTKATAAVAEEHWTEWKAMNGDHKRERKSGQTKVFSIIRCCWVQTPFHCLLLLLLWDFFTRVQQPKTRSLSISPPPLQHVIHLKPSKKETLHYISTVLVVKEKCPLLWLLLPEMQRAWIWKAKEEEQKKSETPSATLPPSVTSTYLSLITSAAAAVDDHQQQQQLGLKTTCLLKSPSELST